MLLAAAEAPVEEEEVARAVESLLQQKLQLQVRGGGDMLRWLKVQFADAVLTPQQGRRYGLNAVSRSQVAS